MTDVDFLSPLADQTMLAAHTEALSRADGKTGVVDGNRVIPSEPASLTVTVEAGRIRIAGAPIDAEEDTGTADAADLTNPRIDIIYRDEVGAVAIAKGTPAAIEDPKSLGNWKSYTSPSPPDAIPAGSILAALWIPAESTSISASQIWMFAGRVDDIATEIGTPGSDALSPSEKAVRTAIGTCAPSAQGVTNGNTHDHNGGDGAQIAHSNLSGIGTNTHSQIDSHVGSTSNPHSTTASQVGADITTSTVHTATEKNPLHDNDEIPVTDSEATYVLKKITFGNLRAKLKDFNTQFQFGDGVYVISAGQQFWRIPVASKITAAYIESRDSEGTALSGSITCTLYKFTLGAAKGNAVDSFVLDAAASYSETGLNITVNAQDYLMIIVSGISTVKQILLTLKMERT